MKQVLQDLSSGTTHLTDVPSPAPAPGHLLIHTSLSLLSAGTERMVVAFGKANWLEKARQQPDKVRMVLDKVRTDGLAPTIEAVQSKLAQPLALGYCNVGVVAELGAGVEGFAVGDRVASNGKHAEVVSVPKNLCARIPDAVSDEQAAFTVLAAIGLQGIRLLGPTLGECVVVTGLGLIGLLTVQLLRAQGCRVLGVDHDPKRRALAKQLGAEVVDATLGEDVLAAARACSRGRGVDGVLITASTTSSEPVSQAAAMCRQRGRIVLVGVTGLELSRADFYEKELSFQVSCSYGPGRYDPAYEEGGHDYPVGFVRWTEQRNLEAVLDLMGSGSLNVASLISHRYELESAPKAYELLTSKEPSLGIVLRYPGATASPGRGLDVQTVPLANAPCLRRAKPRLCLVGAGNYGSRVLLPAFQAAGASIATVVSQGGVSAVHWGRKYGAAKASTDATAAIADSAVDTVVVATRHDSHARYVLAALREGKHVFCEKPLCLTLDELRLIEEEVERRPDQALMVGFNRRFAPQVIRMKELLASVSEPKSFIMTVNAGAIPATHWTQNPALGGGRIVGEGCHFIDLLRHLTGAPIVRHSARSLGPHPGLLVTSDKTTITLEFADGSVGAIHYLANGHKALAKERLEVFCGGRVLQLDNFRTLRGWGWKGFSVMRLWRQDKGAEACVRGFVAATRGGGRPPIPTDELIEVSRVAIELAEALK